MSFSILLSGYTFFFLYDLTSILLYRILPFHKISILSSWLMMQFLQVGSNFRASILSDRVNKLHVLVSSQAKAPSFYLESLPIPLQPRHLLDKKLISTLWF